MAIKMKMIKDFIRWFLYITTGILIVCAVNFGITDGDQIPKDTLWQILLSGFLTTGVTMLLYPRDENKKSAVFVRCFIHYAMLCVVMILCGQWFGWMDFDFGGIVMMSISVASVYLLSFTVYYIIDLKRAEEINRKLKEKYGDS